MYSLSVFDQHSFGDAYVLEVVRTPSGLATISTDQKLTVLDPTRLSAGPIVSQTTHHENLAVLRALDGGLACTAGENGTVAVWDFRIGGKFSQVAQFQASQAPIMSMACEASTNTIAVGTELKDHMASIFLWDVRANPTQKAHYQEVHSDDITELNFHATQPALLLSGSTDGLVNVYDTRIEDEDEVTVQTFNHGSSIHHASFLAPGSEVLALSHDEQFALYDVSEEKTEGSATQDFGDLRKTMGCQYVANVVPKMDGVGAVIGAGAQDKNMFELVFLAKHNSQWGLDRENTVGLPGAHGEEIVRSFCFFDEEQIVFTAGEDGCVKAWRGN